MSLNNVIYLFVFIGLFSSTGEAGSLLHCGVERLYAEMDESAAGGGSGELSASIPHDEWQYTMGARVPSRPLNSEILSHTTFGEFSGLKERGLEALEVTDFNGNRISLTAWATEVEGMLAERSARVGTDLDRARAVAPGVRRSDFLGEGASNRVYRNPDNPSEVIRVVNKPHTKASRRRLRRDLAASAALETLTSQFRFRGRRILEVSRIRLDPVEFRQYGITRARFVEGPSASELARAVEFKKIQNEIDLTHSSLSSEDKTRMAIRLFLARRNVSTAENLSLNALIIRLDDQGFSPEEADHWLQSTGKSLDELEEELEAVRAFFQRYHRESLEYFETHYRGSESLNGLNRGTRATREVPHFGRGTNAGWREVGFDMNHGANVIYDTQRNVWVIIDG